MAIERQPVKSSNILSVGYDDGSKTLEVEYKGGAVYRFTDIAAETHVALRDAESVGKFLRTLSKGTRVEQG